MTLHRVHLADCTPQPWRNGGGTTRELLAGPQAADWQLRVSVADIERDGPFSSFPGVERWFVATDGEGVELDLPSGPACIAAGDAPPRFDGEAAPACRLLNGPTRDLNLMQRRGSGTAAVHQAHAGDTLDGSFAWRALYVSRRCSISTNSPNPCPREPCCGPTPEEAWRGVTVNAARALGLRDRGMLAAGQRADFVVWDAAHPRDLAYRFGHNSCRRVVRGGVETLQP